MLLLFAFKKIFFLLLLQNLLNFSFFFVQRIFQNILKSSHDIIVLLKSIAVQKISETKSLKVKTTSNLLEYSGQLFVT